MFSGRCWKLMRLGKEQTNYTPLLESKRTETESFSWIIRSLLERQSTIAVACSLLIVDFVGADRQQSLPSSISVRSFLVLGNLGTHSTTTFVM
jgi:hypothetical protein